MVAGIFAAHGCWTGELKPPDEDHPRGIFENRALYELLHRLGGEIGPQKAMRGELAGADPRFKDSVLGILDEQEYNGGPWMMKHGSEWWRMWDDFDPTFVVTYRARRPTWQAWEEHRGVLRGSKVALDTYRAANQQVIDAGGHEVDPRTIAQGRYDTLLPAFEEAGIEFKAEVADTIVVPEQWHHV